MESTTLNPHRQALQAPEVVDALSLYRALEQVTDHRQKRGVRYRLVLILSLVVLGKLAGMTSFAGNAEWVRLRSGWLKQVLPLTRASLPCASAYGNVVRVVEPEELTQFVAEWLTRLSATRWCGSESGRLLMQTGTRNRQLHLALDGKTLRGTLGHAALDQQRCHLAALYEAQTGVVLAEPPVPGKRNEISLEATLLTPTHVKRRFVTADAMHTQRACCADITYFGGDYVLLAKANQPMLEGVCTFFFAGPPVDCRDWRQARTCTKGHGRLKIRELVESRELNEFLAGNWPGVEQVYCLKRTVHRQGKVHTQTVYGITSLSPEQASSARLLELVRRRLRHRKSTTLATRCDLAGRSQPGAQRDRAPGVAALNNLVLAVFDFLGSITFPSRGACSMPSRTAPSIFARLLAYFEIALVAARVSWR